MLINFPVVNKQQVSVLSFFLLLSLALESLVDRSQTLIKKISKILNCLFGRTKSHQFRERSQEVCYNILSFLTQHRNLRQSPKVRVQTAFLYF